MDTIAPASPLAATVAPASPLAATVAPASPLSATVAPSFPISSTVAPAADDDDAESTVTDTDIFYEEMDELFHRARDVPRMTARALLAAFARTRIATGSIIVDTTSPGNRCSVDFFPPDEWYYFRKAFIDGRLPVPYHSTPEKPVYWGDLEVKIIDDQGEVAVIMMHAETLLQHIKDALPYSFFEDKSARKAIKTEK